MLTKEFMEQEQLYLTGIEPKSDFIESCISQGFKLERVKRFLIFFNFNFF